MSVSDVTARIQQIQSALALLSPPRTNGTSSTASSAAFASALASAKIASATTTPAAAAATASAAPVATTTAAPLPATATIAGAPSTGQAVVGEAKKYLGIPYVWGGTNPKTGLDCSGLLLNIYKKFGIDLPRVSRDQAKVGTAVANLAQAKPGDLVAFNNPVSHIGIYMGDNKILHAPRPGQNVKIEEIWATPSAIRRVLPEVSTVSARTNVGAGSAVSGSVPYASVFNQASMKYGVSATLLAAVAKQESGYNPSARSAAGAQGLMQLMPATARGLGVSNPLDPAEAVNGAARLIKSLLNEFGRVDLALAAYNAGPGAVHRYKGIPPYRETQHYVPAVLAIQNALAA